MTKEEHEEYVDMRNACYRKRSNRNRTINYFTGFDDGFEQAKKQLEEQINKMKCCENCKYNSYWGNELHCNYGLKEALQKDELVECENMDKWEMKEVAE